MIVFIPLADSLHGNHNKRTDHQYKNQSEHDLKDRKAGTETGKTKTVKTKPHTNFLSSNMQSEALHCCKASVRN